MEDYYENLQNKIIPKLLEKLGYSGIKTKKLLEKLGYSGIKAKFPEINK